MAAKAKSFSRPFLWAVIALLIVGLAGFGATNLSGTVRTVGHVGDEAISVDAFARELQREIRAMSEQTGRAVTLAEAREIGLDRVVLSRLVQLAALDHEAGRAGVSIGDAYLQREIVGIPAFQGADGSFDREGYRFALDNAGLGEAEFEEDLRDESARTILQAAVLGGVEMPETLAVAIADYIGARRSFTWAAVGAEALEGGVADPDEATLRAWHEANAGDFTLPETRALTYILLTPEDLLDEIEIEDAAVRRLYEDRLSEFERPERRVVDRLAFADEEAASGAMAQLEVGGASFETLVDARGLALSDVDLGEVDAGDLGAAAETVFAASAGDVVGPVPTDLGPALFRIREVIAAESTAFEDVAGALRDELALDQARRRIEARAEPIEDLLAGGATLEEVAAETELALGTLDWTPESDEGPAAYAAFAEAAASASEDDFPQVAFLEDGGIFALRLDEVRPPRPEPFESAQERVREAWRAEQLRERLAAAAETVRAELEASGDFAATGLPQRVENALTRSAYIDAAPEGLVEAAFEMEPGEYRVVTGEDGAAVIRLDAIVPPEEGAGRTQLRDGLVEQQGQALAQALFTAFARDAQLRAGATIDQQAVNAVLASLN